jgi:hypothetical protein
MFKIVKTINGWFHRYNNGAKSVNISDFEVTLDEVANTFVIVQRNGSNIPLNKLSVNEIEVIDETDESLVETFTNVIDLKARLMVLGYTAYLGAGNADSITGLIQQGTNVTITGSGTLADPYIINSIGGGGGGTTPTLQEVTNEGATTTNSIQTGNVYATDVNGGESPFNSIIDTNNILSFLSVYQINNSNGGVLTADNLTNGRLWNFRDIDGDIAFLSDIPSISGLASESYVNAKVEDTIVNGVTDKAPSQNAVFDALNLKVDKTNWVDISLTSTIVGFSSFTTRVIRYKQISDNVIWVKGELSGVSNSGLLNFTIPFTSANNVQNAGIAGVVNNNLTQTVYGVITSNANSNIVVIFRDFNGQGFTNSNNKSGRFSILIEIQ